MDITHINSDLVLASALRLLFANGTTTTLEVKNEIRKRHPNEYITQNIVSDVMIVLHSLGYFTYLDNGTYRIYSLNVDAFAEVNNKSLTIKDINITKFDAYTLINNLVSGDKITATFKKKDNKIRTLKGVVETPNLGAGYILVRDLDLKDNNIRTIDIRRLISFIIDDINYTIQ